jgi:hypothetical protein
MRAVLPLVILLGVCACSREAAAPATAARKDPGTTTAVVQAAEDSVAAVLQSSGKSAYSLRFALEGRLVAGKEARMRLDFTGEPGPLTLRFQSEALLPEPSTATVVLPEDGSTASQAISLKSRTVGIAEMMVRLQPAGENAKEVVYAIPVLVESAASK